MFPWMVSPLTPPEVTLKLNSAPLLIVMLFWIVPDPPNAPPELTVTALFSDWSTRRTPPEATEVAPL